MDDLKLCWSIIAEYHDRDEVFHLRDNTVYAESIGEAIEIVDGWLADGMEVDGWSDYHIIGANIVPELH